jgi:hypothetical protein
LVDDTRGHGCAQESPAPDPKSVESTTGSLGAGVAAQFAGIVRVADATGIPVDPGDGEFTQAIQAELGISEKSE